jgi:PAS domain S-box-containing protein
MSGVLESYVGAELVPGRAARARNDRVISNHRMQMLTEMPGQPLSGQAPLPPAAADPIRSSPFPAANTQARATLYEIESRYHTLIESLPQRVFFKDFNSVFLSVNAAFAADLGLQPENLIGKTDYDFFPRELAVKYCADDQRIMTQRQPETLEEINVSGGKRRIVEVVKTPVVGDDGDVIGLLGIFTDITERKLAEAALRDLATRLERSNRELQDFAYVASHDLQEPLRKVIVFGDRLKLKCGQALGEAGRDYLDRMTSAAARMQTLINDLLTFARVTAKAQPLAPVDLAKVVREVLSDLEARIEQLGAQVEVGGLPTIEAEPLQMRRLLQNLIGNALKFHCPGERPVVKIAATVLRQPESSAPRHSSLRESLRLTVADNGTGFDEKYLDRIFNVFQRLHSRSAYEGTGMGLAIARRIVEHHGGQITAQSRPGEGATFIVELPVHQLQS